MEKIARELGREWGLVISPVLSRIFSTSASHFKISFPTTSEPGTGYHVLPSIQLLTCDQVLFFRGLRGMYVEGLFINPRSLVVAE